MTELLIMLLAETEHLGRESERSRFEFGFKAVREAEFQRTAGYLTNNWKTALGTSEHRR